MDRRRFLLTSLAGVLAAPLAAEAQKAGRVYRIGVLANEPSPMWEAFRQRLKELGYVEGQNIVFEYRWSAGQVERFPSLAAELVGLKVDVIVTVGNAATGALKRATTTVPIVMATSGDPVGAGLVTSLAHPGGNVTGLTMAAGRDMGGKQLELLKEVVPKFARVAYMFDAANPGSLLAQKELEAAARALDVGLRLTEIRKENDLEADLTAITKERVGALLVAAGPFETVHRRRIVDLAASSRLPAMYGARWFVDDGGLIQGPRPHDPAVAAGAGGSGHRVSRGVREATQASWRRGPVVGRSPCRPRPSGRTRDPEQFMAPGDRRAGL